MVRTLKGLEETTELLEWAKEEVYEKKNIKKANRILRVVDNLHKRIKEHYKL